MTEDENKQWLLKLLKFQQNIEKLKKNKFY